MLKICLYLEQQLPINITSKNKNKKNNISDDLGSTKTWPHDFRYLQQKHISPPLKKMDGKGSSTSFPPFYSMYSLCSN